KSSTPVRMTADYAYFRLRDEGYAPEDIAKWARTIRSEAAQCRDVYVYFKHEEAGTGPEFARLLLKELAARRVRGYGPATGCHPQQQRRREADGICRAALSANDIIQSR